MPKYRKFYMVKSGMPEVLALFALVLACGCGNQPLENVKTEKASAKTPDLFQASGTPPSIPSDAPEITFDKKSSDLGEVLAGTTVREKFLLSNQGKSLLRVQAIKTSCSRCTAAIPRKRELQPGESTEIDVKVNTKDISGPASYFINVISNDPREPKAALELKFSVFPPLTWIPKEIIFGDVQENRPAQANVSIECRTTDTLRLTPLPLNSDLFQLDITNDKTSGSDDEAVLSKGRQVAGKENGSKLNVQKVVLVCKLNENAPEGNFLDELRFKTNIDGFSDIRIPVSGTVLGASASQPKEVFLGIVPFGSKVAKEIHLSLPAGVNVLQPSTDVTGLTVAAEPADEGCLLHLEYVAPSTEGLIEGSIQVDTTPPVSPALRISVEGMVQSPSK